MVSQILFSSITDDWETPQSLFDELKNEFPFGLDVAASKSNAKCFAFYTEQDNALDLSWKSEEVRYLPGWTWCNPPYSKSKYFIKKAYKEMQKGAKIVMLLPARTDTIAFHKYIYKQPNVEIRFIRGRLKFGGSKNSAPFPSMLVIYGTNET